MGKRSNFERVERDFYPTPVEAVIPLIPHLPDPLWYWEPCAGDGALANALDTLHTGVCEPSALSDIEPMGGAVLKANAFLSKHPPSCTDYIITNPPWNRKILHPMIEHFSAMKPTWLLFDADWMHTKQSAQYMHLCAKIVSVGRVKWIPDSKMTGKDNCAWYLFMEHAKQTEFYGR